ncbi:MAG: hypothetical protein E7260_12715 [Lachnospiraceae bacterium]|nr:hypothetical protein [Lachnospiraceae bacterium]
MINVLKKMLRQELGTQKYSEYADSIKNNIKQSARDTSEIFNGIYAQLREKEAEELEKVQENLNASLLASFKIGKEYLGTFLVYVIAFFILGTYTVQLVAVPGILLLSVLFLLKTYEYVVNKFCYVDARMVLIFRAALERVLLEQGRKIKPTE